MSQRNLAMASLALITLKVPDKPNCSAVDPGRYLRSVRAAVKRCTYEASDLILPAMHVSGLDRMVHIAAFTGDEGVKAMVERIQAHLCACVELQPLEGSFELSGRLIGLSTACIEHADEAARNIAHQLSLWIGLTTETGQNDESKKE